MNFVVVVVVVQSLSCIHLFVTPWAAARTAAHQASLSFTLSQSFAETHVHWVGDAIQHLILCRRLLLLPSIFPSIRVFSNESSLCIRWPKASASVLPENIQDLFPLGLAGLISLQPKGLWRVCSNTTVQKYQFFGAQPSLWSSFHIHTWLVEKPYFWLYSSLLAK